MIYFLSSIIWRKGSTLDTGVNRLELGVSLERRRIVTGREAA